MFSDVFIKNIVGSNWKKEEKRKIFQNTITAENISLLEGFDIFVKQAKKIYDLEEADLLFLMSHDEIIPEYGKYGVGERAEIVQRSQFGMHGGVKLVADFFGLPPAYIYHLIENGYLKRTRNGKYAYKDVEEAIRRDCSIAVELAYLIELEDEELAKFEHDFIDKKIKKDAYFADNGNFTNKKREKKLSKLDYIMADDFGIFNDDSELTSAALDILEAKYNDGFKDGYAKASEDMRPKIKDAFNEGYALAKSEAAKLIEQAKKEKKCLK